MGLSLSCFWRNNLFVCLVFVWWFLFSKGDCQEADCDDTQNEAEMVIFLHCPVHVQPRLSLFRGFNVLEHPGCFWRKHIVEIIGDETGGDDYTKNMRC